MKQIQRKEKERWIRKIHLKTFVPAFALTLFHLKVNCNGSSSQRSEHSGVHIMVT